VSRIIVEAVEEERIGKIKQERAVEEA